VLTLTRIEKSYGAVKALDGLSWSVGAGEVFGLLGPNGAGKTTSIHVAVGLVHPDAGTVDVAGEGSPASPPVRRLLGLAPQANALYDDLTAEENLLFFGRVNRVPAGELRGRIGRLLSEAGLSDRGKDRVRGFSGGMKRRLNLAVARVHDPKVLLLDEPTAGVDPQSRAALLDQVRALKADGRAIVYTTHLIDEAERVCDRVAIVDHGRVLAEGTADALVTTHGGDATVVIARKDGTEERFRSADPAADLAKRLSQGDVRSVRVDRPDLESVFLTLTGRSLRDA
jgi:ABC-2 type transport system ATP-binding protein